MGPVCYIAGYPNGCIIVGVLLRLRFRVYSSDLGSTLVFFSFHAFFWPAFSTKEVIFIRIGRSYGIEVSGGGILQEVGSGLRSFFSVGGPDIFTGILLRTRGEGFGQIGPLT